MAFIFELNVMNDDYLLAFKRATIIWIATIPIYACSWICLYMFYKKGHIWKSRGVVIGYQFNNNLVEEEHRDIQENFVGQWTSHCDEKENTLEDDLELVSMK